MEGRLKRSGSVSAYSVDRGLAGDDKEKRIGPVSAYCVDRGLAGDDKALTAVEVNTINPCVIYFLL